MQRIDPCHLLPLVLACALVAACAGPSGQQSPAAPFEEPAEPAGTLPAETVAAETPALSASQEPLARRNFEAFQEAIVASEVGSGGAAVAMEHVGRLSLANAIEYGLNPDHRVLDIGAGSLRVGWWLINFVGPENFAAIEPVRKRIDTAAEIMDVEFVRTYNYDFEYPEGIYDFVFARSIWSHASKGMISKMLSEFREHSNQDSKFLSSIVFAKQKKLDYLGDEWVGKVEKDDSMGVIMHLRSWLEAECEKFDLTMEVKDGLLNQTWVLIGRK